MKLTDEFPLMFCLNLARRTDRRFDSEDTFNSFCIPVKRFPAIDANWVSQSRGFTSKGRYAHALGTRLIIRKAMLARASAVFIFEDDVTLQSDLHARLAEIELPEDWGMFYLGGLHLEPPETVSPGLVRVNGCLSTHAFGVRAQYFRRVMRAISGRERQTYDQCCLATDASLARLHSEIPTYAAFPSLAGQRMNHSDLMKGTYRAFHDDGQQVEFTPVLEGLIAESLGGRAYLPAKKAVSLLSGNAWFQEASIPSDSWRKRWEAIVPTWPTTSAFTPQGKIAFLFVTVGEQNHANIWHDYWNRDRDHVNVYGHTRDKERLTDDWLATCQINERYPTQWGDINVVRAEMALLREALLDSSNQFFVFASESCIPVRPFEDLVRFLKLDPRSHFTWQTVEDLRKLNLLTKASRIDNAPRIPTKYWAFHSQWIVLNREAAVLVVEDDFTEAMSEVDVPDECYIGTVLRIKGYPLEEFVTQHQLTWATFVDTNPHPNSYRIVDSDFAASLYSSGCFFARKFPAASNVGDFRLHQSAKELISI